MSRSENEVRVHTLEHTLKNRVEANELTASNSEIEWLFPEEDTGDTSQWSLAMEETVSRVQQKVPPQPLQRLYEVLLGFFVLYGVFIFFIWWQSAQRIDRLETELNALRTELAQAPGGMADWTEHGEMAVAWENLSSSQFVETDSLRFVVNAQTAELLQSAGLHLSGTPPPMSVMESIAEASDAKYRQLRRDFGLPLPTVSAKPTIYVDQMVPADSHLKGDLVLYVSYPNYVLEQYKISEADGLKNEIFMKLSQHVLEEALKGREIQPQWQAMTLVLKTHLWLENGHNQAWQSDSALLDDRHRAQSHSIDLVLQTHYDMETGLVLQFSTAAYAMANPLVEFIVETYGSVPALLDAFESHDAWQTLAPAVFGIPTGELEKQWHEYLREKYPRSG